MDNDILVKYFSLKLYDIILPYAAGNALKTLRSKYSDLYITFHSMGKYRIYNKVMVQCNATEQKSFDWLQNEYDEILRCEYFEIIDKMIEKLFVNVTKEV